MTDRYKGFMDQRWLASICRSPTDRGRVKYSSKYFCTALYFITNSWHQLLWYREPNYSLTFDTLILSYSMHLFPDLQLRICDSINFWSLRRRTTCCSLCIWFLGRVVLIMLGCQNICQLGKIDFDWTPSRSLINIVMDLVIWLNILRVHCSWVPRSEMAFTLCYFG